MYLELFQCKEQIPLKMLCALQSMPRAREHRERKNMQTPDLAHKSNSSAPLPLASPGASSRHPNWSVCLFQHLPGRDKGISTEDERV